MRATQFWILLMASILVSVLMIKQIFLNRSINKQQRVLVDSQEISSSATFYENSWKQLAIKMYQVGKTDPEIMDLLKKSNVNIGVIPPTNAPPTNPGGSLPSTSSKPQVAPGTASHP